MLRTIHKTFGIISIIIFNSTVFVQCMKMLNKKFNVKQKFRFKMYQTCMYGDSTENVLIATHSLVMQHEATALK